MNYSNPRKEDTFTDWPSGRYRTTARFYVETCPRTGRERMCRVTVNPKTGRECAPKKLTYALRMRLVDGDDGKTYIIEDNTDYGHITVFNSTMDSNHETLYAGRYGNKDPRFDDVMRLFD